MMLVNGWRMIDDNRMNIPLTLIPSGFAFAMASASASWNCDGCGGLRLEGAGGPIVVLLESNQEM